MPSAQSLVPHPTSCAKIFLTHKSAFLILPSTKSKFLSIVDKIKPKSGGKDHTTEKKDLADLLREPYAEEIFGKDLLILMKYVLIELGGYNLRNNVSHALMFRENYLLSYGHWVFIILLRIGAYQISIKPNEEPK